MCIETACLLCDQTGTYSGLNTVSREVLHNVSHFIFVLSDTRELRLLFWCVSGYMFVTFMYNNPPEFSTGSFNSRM